MADFKQAVMWMEEGKKVFRENWRDKTFHIFEKRTYYLSSNKKDFTFHREDFEGTDWEIYDKISLEEIEAEFNKFIKNWCGNMKGHLLDSDANDGEKFRNKLRKIFAVSEAKE